jgi:hypothetical protein
VGTIGDIFPREVCALTKYVLVSLRRLNTFHEEFIPATKSLRSTKMCGAMTVQIHAFDKNKLLFEANGISICDSNERLAEGFTHFNL